MAQCITCHYTKTLHLSRYVYRRSRFLRNTHNSNNSSNKQKFRIFAFWILQMILCHLLLICTGGKRSRSTSSVLPYSYRKWQISSSICIHQAWSVTGEWQCRRYSFESLDHETRNFADFACLGILSSSVLWFFLYSLSLCSIENQMNSSSI